MIHPSILVQVSNWKIVKFYSLERGASNLLTACEFQSGMEDIVCWCWKAKGIFTVKSMYLFLNSNHVLWVRRWRGSVNTK